MASNAGKSPVKKTVVAKVSGDPRSNPHWHREVRTQEQWQAALRSDPELLRRTVRALRQDATTRRSELLKESTIEAKMLSAEITSAQNTFRNFMHGKQNMRVAQREWLVNYFIEMRLLHTRGSGGGIEATSGHAEFAASLCNYLKISAPTRAALPKRFCGEYKLFMPSAYRPGYFVRGSLVVRAQPNAEGLYVREHHDHKGNDGSLQVSETFEGVLIEKKSVPVILSSGMSRDDGSDRGALRMFMVNQYLPDSGPVATMLGYSLMFIRGAGLVGRAFYLERIASMEHFRYLDTVDIIPASDVPKSIQDRLSSASVIDGLLRFR